MKKIMILLLALIMSSTVGAVQDGGGASGEDCFWSRLDRVCGFPASDDCINSLARLCDGLSSSSGGSAAAAIYRIKNKKKIKILNSVVPKENLKGLSGP